MNTPIADFIEAYEKAEIARFHMPGHKGKGDFYRDITEIRGADELYAADGIINESEENASRLFKSAHSYYSTEGSTLAIKAMLTLASCERPCGERPLFVAARNCHKAFVYGMAMLDGEVSWVYSDDSHICKCDITPKRVEEAIRRCRRKPDGVYVTSPDYLGNIADIRGIAEVCDRCGVPLLVDNAHGAYLAFLEENMHPMALGASMCADSAHKTLPVLTGGAYLHIAKKAERFCSGARAAMSLYASTSPSYLILRSLDLCNRYLFDDGRERFFDTVGRVKDVKERLAKNGMVTEGDEPLKITLNAPASGYFGAELADAVRRAGIEPELADGDYVVFMVTEFNSDAELERLFSFLCSLEGREPIETENVSLGAANGVISIREAVFADFESVSVTDAEGRICASPTVSCPPAVPIAVSGELIDAARVRAFLRYGINSVCVVKK